MGLPVPTGNDRPNSLPWPPIIDVTVLAAAWVMEKAFPVSMMMTDVTVRMAGWLAVAAGLAIAGAGIGYFKSVGATVNPAGGTSTLATGGIYAWTRNPMYLGTVVAFFGLALALGSAWLVVGALLMPLPLRKLAIDREEAYLGRRFGAEYEAYKARVRRWL
jgi:protein-S-isoprenylcysteine O-methyltransferase Ste14